MASGFLINFVYIKLFLVGSILVQCFIIILLFYNLFIFKHFVGRIFHWSIIGCISTGQEPGKIVSESLIVKQITNHESLHINCVSWA
jgi:hypothetical protein